MKHIVFLPGIAADERIFDFIEINNCTKQFIKWNKPEKNDTFGAYLDKIKKEIETKNPPVLIGVSLGGIFAMELRELIHVEKTILISSVKSKEEMPLSLELIRRLRINEILPVALIKKSAPVIKRIIVDTSNEEAWNRFKEMLKDTDSVFIKSAFRFALDWKRKEFNKENIVHIHGTNDKVFPIRNIKSCDYVIENGSHDMVMTRAQEISKIIIKEIFTINKIE